MTQKPGTPYFLFSFIPAVAYWLLETYSTLEMALIGGIALGLLEMALEKKLTGHVHTLSKLNVALIVVLGSVSLMAKEGVWFRLQPTFTGIAIAGFLVYKKIRKQSLMVEMLRDFKQTPPLPSEFYAQLEWHLCLFLIAFALFMAHVAVNLSTSTWVFWKTGGFYIVFGIFMVGEMIFLRHKLRKSR
jgi:intracellular septation protein